MMTHLDLRHTKTPPVRHHGDETVELAIELQMDIFDNFTAVGFETTVDIVQV